MGKVSDAATQSERWIAQVQSLDKHWFAYSLPWPCSVAALRIIRARARGWFDDWQQVCFETCASLTFHAYHRPSIACEVWAQKRGPGAGARQKRRRHGRRPSHR
eukprot:4684972-Pyramimonas_sp.AAC.1